MDDFTNIVFFISIVFIIGIRFFISYYFNWKKSAKSFCISCKKEKDRVNEGKYKCVSCNSIFYVNYQGHSYIPKGYWALLSFVISLAILSFAVYTCLFPETPKFSNLPSKANFDNVFIPVFLFTFGIIMIINSILQLSKFNEYHANSLKDIKTF